jgi:hypothetical protein
MALSEDLNRIAASAEAHRAPGQEVVAVMTVESAVGDRLYLAAFADGADAREWLVLDENGRPVTDRDRVREAASIAALVEVAEEAVDRVAEEPRVASLAYLDSIGADSGIAAALPAVEELTSEVERHYKLELG